MQQENQSAGPASPFDFITKDQQPQKKPVFALPNMPRPALFALYAIVGLIILIIVYALIFGGKTSGADKMAGIVGRAGEIARVSDEVVQASQDPATQNLASTTETALKSDSARLSAYLSSHHVKISQKQLALYTNKNTDAQVQTAVQNNNLGRFYVDYLKTSLPGYANAIKQVFPSASASSKTILNDAFNNAQVILSSPQVKSS
ncbi:MAG TPA: hypothetical protein VHK86_08075 [Nitrososphaera sp.]|jgi:hypothetical protein|nr:hypothetical protein [Nitrososphaera sp.]